ncbi:MAG: hypothetical protein V1779_04085 [bacterium]
MKSVILNIISILFLISCQEANITPWVPPTIKPTEKDTVWGDYFPNSPGTEWEYNIIIDTQYKGTVKIKIDRRILLPDTNSASVWNFDESGNKYSQYIAIIADSVFFFTDIVKLSDKLKILKSYILPVNNYGDWNVRNLEQSFGNDKSSGGSLIGSVTVPAGKFDNVYEIERITDAQDRKAHEWISFVAGVGLIRKETLDNNTNKITVWELKSYVIK